VPIGHKTMFVISLTHRYNRLLVIEALEN